MSIIADMSPVSRLERNARVLSALGEPGGGRAPEVFASARLALSAVGERAGLVLGLHSNASQPFARVLLALGEAGCGLALGQSSIGRLARHCVGNRAEPKANYLAGPRRHQGWRALKPEWLRRLTSQSKGRLRAAHSGAPHWPRWASASKARLRIASQAIRNWPLFRPSKKMCFAICFMGAKLRCRESAF